MTYKEKKDFVPEYDSEEGYDLYADQYVHDEQYLNKFDQVFFLRHLRNLKDIKILDMGAGTGRLAPVFLKRGANHVTALDISQRMLDVAKTRKVYERLVKEDIRDFTSFEFEEFDLIISTMLLVHISTKDIPHVMGECARILKKGGKMILVSLAQRRPPRLTTTGGDKIVIDSYSHSDARVLKELRIAGFEDEVVETYEIKSEVLATFFIVTKT